MNKLFTATKNLFIKFCQQGINDRANFIKNITVTGFILSSLAQAGAIFFNDKIPVKEKKFLIPQEIFDCCLNSTLFLLITSKAINFGKKLVLNKHILPKSLSQKMCDFIPNIKNIEILKSDFIKHLQKKATSTEVEFANNLIEGTGVVSGIGAAIVANNVVTPILRNKLAGLYQRKSINERFSHFATVPKLNLYSKFYKIY